VWSAVAAADLLDSPEDDRAVRMAHELLRPANA
jgi:hypothetical protein